MDNFFVHLPYAKKAEYAYKLNYAGRIDACL